MKPVLSVRGLDKRFGAVVAADALSIDIAAGQKVSLIGANGAGKTTFVNMVTGYLKPDCGSIELDGMDIGRRSPRNVARLGISRSFQIPQLFIELTAAENLAVAVSGTRAQALSFHSPAEAQGRRDKALELLARVRPHGCRRPSDLGTRGRRAQTGRHCHGAGPPAEIAAAGRADLGRLGRREVRHHGPRDSCRRARCRHHRLRRARHGDRRPLRRPGGGVLPGPDPRRRRIRTTC